MCHECKEVETKVCKICSEEKPANEFLSNQNICKVCDYFKRHKNIIIKENWTIEEYRIILDNLLNRKVEYINEICKYLNNKSLEQLCLLLNSDLKIAGKTPIRIKGKCVNCNIDISIKLYQFLDKQQHFCSYKCNGEYQANINNQDKIILHKRICQYCGIEFEVSTGKVTASKDKYCSPKCSQESRINKIKFNCEYCGKEHELIPYQYNRSKNHFCCHECADKYRSEQSKETRICEICEKEYKCKIISTQRFCSTECQNIWQSQYLVGENSNGYNHYFSIEDRTKQCEWCGKDFLVKPYEIDNESKRFCCKECRQEWFEKVWCQQEENKQAMRERSIYILENGLVSQTQSKPQLIVNELLDKINIKYVNEKAFDYTVVDNYLVDYNLIIEVMGTYWHCDSRKYPNINYDIQVNRIRMDKIKHTTILNNYNIQILYLWEYDIYNYPDLCLNLIREYIKNKGILQNYHSCNYTYNGDLILNTNIIVPYMDWNFDDLKMIINTSVKEKMSRKQIDKWTTYNCELCGKEKEQLTSHYIKQEHHYCSSKCSSESRKNRHVVHCNNCNNEIQVTKYKYDKNERYFCNQNCQHEYQRNIGFKLDKSDLNNKS